MGDFLRNMFGGSDSKQQSTSTPTDMTPDAFKGLQGPFADYLRASLSSGQVGPEYSGPLNANMTGNEGNILTQLMGQTGGGTARSGLIQDTIGGKFLNSNPFLNSAIEAAQRPTLQGLEETLTRSLPGRFTAGGQFIQPQGSSAFDRAAGIATRGAADAVGDIATKMSFGNFEAERGRQQEAVALDRAEVDSSIANLQAQALPRLIQELGIERGLALFQQRTQSILQLLQTLGGVTSPTVANTGQSTGETTQRTGIVPGITGAFKAAFPLGV